MLVSLFSFFLFTGCESSSSPDDTSQFDTGEIMCEAICGEASIFTFSMPMENFGVSIKVTTAQGTSEEVYLFYAGQNVSESTSNAFIYVTSQDITVSTEMGLPVEDVEIYIDGMRIVPTYVDSSIETVCGTTCEHKEYTLYVDDIDIPCAAVCSETKTFHFSTPLDFYSASLVVSSSLGTSEELVVEYNGVSINTETIDPYAFVILTSEYIIISTEWGFAPDDVQIAINGYSITPVEESTGTTTECGTTCIDNHYTLDVENVELCEAICSEAEIFEFTSPLSAYAAQVTFSTPFGTDTVDVAYAGQTAELFGLNTYGLVVAKDDEIMIFSDWGSLISDVQLVIDGVSLEPFDSVFSTEDICNTTCNKNTHSLETSGL
ncbi:MAG: hypothetical protein CMK59_06440 [Proteobacteria bacterium]|nr:hypothetical protein [Pseudomonadota bacterium]